MELSNFIREFSPNDLNWDPFSSIHEKLLDPLGRFTSEFDKKSFGSGGTPLVWDETPDLHFVKADLSPEMSKDDIIVKVLDGSILSISGEKKKGLVQEKNSWRCVERSSGKFRWQLEIPKNAIVKEVKANVDNGVLTVTFPKMRSSDTETPQLGS